MKKSVVFLSLFVFLGCETLMTREGVREAEQKREITDRVTTLQKSNAEVSTRFSEIEADQRQMVGRIEVLENRLSQATAERDRQKKISEESSGEMQKRVAILQEEVSKLNDQMAALATEVAALRAGEGSANRKEVAVKNMYEVAEDLYDKKDYKKAILNYQKFRESKPKDKHVPDAILKIAISFQELGMKDESRTFYEELITKFPNSPEAKRARIRLKKLK